MSSLTRYKPTIIESGLIQDTGDFLRLGIVDWRRFGPYWKSEQECMDQVSSRFVMRFTYTIIGVDLYKYPECEDFPGWDHVGRHEQIGRLYWNSFHYSRMGQLYFHDSPDFSGVMQIDGKNYCC